MQASTANTQQDRDTRTRAASRPPDSFEKTVRSVVAALTPTPYAV